jgi:hypothetical protein
MEAGLEKYKENLEYLYTDVSSLECRRKSKHNNNSIHAIYSYTKLSPPHQKSTFLKRQQFITVIIVVNVFSQMTLV